MFIFQAVVLVIGALVALKILHIKKKNAQNACLVAEQTELN